MNSVKIHLIGSVKGRVITICLWRKNFIMLVLKIIDEIVVLDSFKMKLTHFKIF